MEGVMLFEFLSCLQISMDLARYSEARFFAL